MKLQACNKKQVDYKWIIAAACFAMVFTTLGFCSSTKSLYLVTITDALRIKRSLFSINDSCRYISSAVVNLFFGKLVTKFGSKKMIGVGFICLIISMQIYANAEMAFVFYIGGCFLGVGLVWTTTTMVGYVINKWFREQSGTVMGLVLAANGLGGALAVHVISPIIYNNSDVFGYRTAYHLTSIILLVVGVVVVSLIKDNPIDYVSPAKDTVPKNKKRNQTWGGLDINKIAKSSYFYLVALCIFLTGMALQSVNGIAVAYMKDVGINATFVATVLSVHSLALAIFKFLTGFCYDKLGLHGTMLICDIASVFSIFMLAIITNSPIGRVLAMTSGILVSLAMPLTSVFIPIIASHIFNEKSFIKALGILVSINTAGYALGTPVTNWVHDIYGTYRPMLFALSGIMLFVTVCFQTVLLKINKNSCNSWNSF